MNSEGIYFPASSEFFIASNEARFLDFGIAAIQESATAIRLLRNCTGCDWFEVLIDRFPANSECPREGRLLLTCKRPALEICNLTFSQRRFASFVNASFLRENNSFSLALSNKSPFKFSKSAHDR